MSCFSENGVKMLCVCVCVGGGGGRGVNRCMYVCVHVQKWFFRQLQTTYFDV